MPCRPSKLTERGADSSDSEGGRSTVIQNRSREGGRANATINDGSGEDIETGSESAHPLVVAITHLETEHELDPSATEAPETDGGGGTEEAES
ncbi:hypothetical protein NDU88_009346 [Pleurodeles waltl]|uniref:Uncharacterized protein n=1 Tax=Pleurodeles waltl TaxID=8319 RepID=A0AAV7QTD1_PLEWA|nr:hypothetical protein NDU88_009346 [Pleurodeles waltl]